MLMEMLNTEERRRREQGEFAYPRREFQKDLIQAGPSGYQPPRNPSRTPQVPERSSLSGSRPQRTSRPSGSVRDTHMRTPQGSARAPSGSPLRSERAPSRSSLRSERAPVRSPVRSERAPSRSSIRRESSS